MLNNWFSVDFSLNKVHFFFCYFSGDRNFFLVGNNYISHIQYRLLKSIRLIKLIWCLSSSTTSVFPYLSALR